MIIYHQNNIATFAGNHVFYSLSVLSAWQRISATSAAAAGIVQVLINGGLVKQHALIDGGLIS